jgi:ParB family chromosome partitioning protein
VFASALGADVRVAPRKDGYTVTVAIESLQEAEALAERLSFRAAAGD